MRGRRCRTTVQAAKAECKADRVKRQPNVERPNQLWVADFTYVATWSGFVYTAFIIDVFANRIYDNALAESIIGLYKAALYSSTKCLGVACMRWSTQRWNGSTGSTIGDHSNRSATYHRLTSSWHTTSNLQVRPLGPDSYTEHSGKPGAVQVML